MSKIDKMLMSDEQILLKATQSRIFPGGSIVTPNDVYITNKRVIWRDPYMLGLKKNYRSAMYVDIANVDLRRGVFTTEIELTPRFNSEKIVLPAVNKGIADKAFGLIQTQIGQYGLFAQVR